MRGSMTLRQSALVAMLMCAGCATLFQNPPPEASGDDVGEDEIVCRLEAPTGSNRRQRVCYRVKELSPDEREEMERMAGSRAPSIPMKDTGR